MTPSNHIYNKENRMDLFTMVAGAIQITSWIFRAIEKIEGR